MSDETLSASDQAKIDQSVKHAKLVDKSRKLARSIATVHPTPAALRRRKRLEKDLGKWLKYYMADTFPDPWGEAHRTCIKDLQQCIEIGGAYALAVPRGGGKSSIGKGASVYAALSGRRRYIIPIGATDPLASEYIEFSKSNLDGSNDRLLEDYPDCITFFKALEGKAIKAAHQLNEKGEKTGIGWRTKGVTFPTVLMPDGKTLYPYSGARIECRGITSAMKGMAKTVAKSAIIRPDFVIPDDVQTEDDAESDAACTKIEKKLIGTVMALAGPKKRIACYMPCTCVRKGDVSDRFLDRDRHPEFQGKRMPIISKWPDAQDTLWKQYAAIRKAGEDDHKGKAAATAFYRKNRAAMDAGAVVSWKSRIRDGEISALETAENILLELGEEKFWAEMQNDPKEMGVTLSRLTPKIIQARANANRQPCEIPEWAKIVLCATDINPSYALSSVIAAFGHDQRCGVLWYGKHPIDVKDQDTQSTKSLKIIAALEKHGKYLSSLSCRPQGWIIDGGGSPVDTVRTFCETSQQTTSLQGLTAFGRAWRFVVPKGRDIVYQHAYIKRITSLNLHAIFNADYWKETQHQGWLSPMGSPGSCDLPRGEHQDFAEQLCRENIKAKKDLGGGRWFYDWSRSPGPHDYDDCMTMLFALAAINNIGTQGFAPARRTRKTYANKDFATR